MWYKIEDNVLDFRCSLTKKTGLEAAQDAIEAIIKKFPPPYHIMISGGIDSQAMLYAWNKFGKDFIPTHVTYNGNMNRHDTAYVSEFAQKENIDINYIDFDLLSFLENEYDSYANAYECSSPQITAYIRMTKGLAGTVIFGGNFLLSSGWSYNKVQHALTLESYKRSLIPFFFLSYPELAYSAIRLKNMPKVDGYQSRVLHYQLNGFPVVPQDKKYSGFELVKDYYDTELKHLLTPNLKLRYGVIKASKRTFDLVLRYPYEDKFGDIDYKLLVND
jgi:hypothetical protein